MINEILDRLERIDHEEYCGGFEFADSSTFEEMGRCFDERKQLANYIKNLQQENKQLKEKLDIILEDNNQLEEIRIKTIEYIKRTIKIIKEQPSSCELNDIWTLEHLNSFLEILEDKENE